MFAKKIKLKFVLAVLLIYSFSKLDAQITINDVLGDYICNVKHLQTFTGPIINSCVGTKLRFVPTSPTLCNNNDFAALDSGCLTTFFVTTCFHPTILTDSTFQDCGSTSGYTVSGRYYPNDSIYFKLKHCAAPDFYEYFGKKIQTQTGILNSKILNVEIQTYPNPANDKIFINGITSQKNTRVILYNNIGEVIINKNNATEIDVSGIPNGIYFLKLQNETGIENRKVLVQH